VVKQAPVKGRRAVKVNFVLPKDAVAGKVSVVGDFNGWDPLAEGGRWHDDDTGAFEPNGIGGYNAIINT